MTNDKWVNRWVVPSSSGGGDWIVGQDADGKWGCSCPGWTRHIYCAFCGASLKKDDERCPFCGHTEMVRRDCKHIIDAKCGRAKTVAEAVLDRISQ